MRTGIRRFAPTIGVLAFGLTAVLASGCDTVPLTAPGGSAVTLTASSLVLPTGGSAEISAVVIESSGSTVQNGTSVRFTTTMGRIEPADAHTRNGIATATFFAGDVAGLADVRATSGGIGGTTGTGTTATATNQVQIAIGSAAVDAVTVRSSAGSVPATGGTVEVFASVNGTGARPLPNVPVTFSTTAGTLSSSREVSDGNGEAKTRLTTDANATVTAAAGTKTGTIAIQALNPVATPTVTLTATGGTATTVAQLFTFTATVSNNAAVGSPVQFEWNFGDGVTQQGTSPSTSHAYREQLKVFTASVVVRFANGTSVSATADIVTAVFP
jgi:adhesin/invasin